MTTLQQAFAEATKLSPAEQESLAAVILEEIASEKRWNQALANSAKVLELLAQEAMDEHRAGQTSPLNPDQL